MLPKKYMNKIKVSRMLLQGEGEGEGEGEGGRRRKNADGPKGAAGVTG